MSNVRMTIRDLGYSPGILPPGTKNSILDVKDVYIGQNTIGADKTSILKGVTLILSRHPNDIYIPCYAGLHILNGNGEVTGIPQIRDWGFTNTPIAFTNSCSLGIVYQGIWNWILARAKEKGLSKGDISHNYGTPVVGETADWWLNDVYESALQVEDVEVAFQRVLSQDVVEEGQCGGGAGMTCHMFPGGTGTSSRVVGLGTKAEYTVGVLVQSNYGIKFDLHVAGLPVGEMLVEEEEEAKKGKGNVKVEDAVGGKADDGSIVVILITDAPMLPHQLTRLAQHCGIGIAQVGGHGTGRTHSGDIFLALSNANKPNEIVSTARTEKGINTVELNRVETIKNESIDTLFRAASEATEEAVLNSMVAGREGRTGVDGIWLEGFPVERVRELLMGRRRVVG